MGFKLPGKSIQSGTSAHSSALKMVAEQKAASALKAKTSPAKETDWADMHAEANEKYNRYKKLTTEEYKKEALRQSAHHKKTGKWDAGGVYDHEGNKIKKDKSMTKTVEDKTFTKEKPTTKEKQPRVEKSSSSHKIVKRKDGTVKKEVKKDDVGGVKQKTKETFDKEGHIKKSVYTSKKKGEKEKHKVVYDKDTGHEKRTKSVTKGGGKKHILKTKMDDEGTQKKQKEVIVEGGRRTVKKYDAKTGETKTKSRRTLKGWLTGKGKKKKEEKTPDAPAKPE